MARLVADLMLGWNKQALAAPSGVWMTTSCLVKPISYRLERVDIHLVQMNALTRQRIDMNARGVCS